MSFKEIIGQTELKEYLQNCCKTSQVSHAYIFSGEKDCGKMMMAEAFAKTLLCEESNEDACGKCRTCHQFETHNHPDVKYVVPEKEDAKTLGVDDIRVQINDDVVIKPYSSKYKIYIVDEAEKLTPQAQNALLKTIEEPPEYAIIILLTTNAAGFLPTINSRCVNFEFKPISDQLIRKKLNADCGLSEYEAKICASFAQGNLGKAVTLATSEEFNEMKDEVVGILRNIGKDNIELRLESVKKLLAYKTNKDHIKAMLDLMTLWQRDVLLYKSTGLEENLIFKQEGSIIKDQAKNTDYRTLEKRVEAVDRARQRLRSNVNYEATIELLLKEM